MIFDLLTIKDIYNRIQVYPHSSGNLPFYFSSYDDTTGYQIEEGYYFEFKWDGYSNRTFATLELANVLSNSEIYSVAHAIKFKYRSNRGIAIDWGVMGKNAKFPASETFTTATVLLNCSINDIVNSVYIADETYKESAEDATVDFPKKGDYLIIKNIEILQIPS